MAATIGLAADFAPSSVCIFKDAITSSAPKDLPLWKRHAFAQVKRPCFASELASQLSASSPTSSPARRDLCEAVKHGPMTHVDHELIRMRPAVEAV